MKKKFKLESWQKAIAIFLGTASALGIIIKGFATIDNRYAKTQNVLKTQDAIQKIEERLDRKIISDYIEKKTERIWNLEDRYLKIKDKALLDEIRKLNQEIEKLNKELEKIEKDKEGN